VHVCMCVCVCVYVWLIAAPPLPLLRPLGRSIPPRPRLHLAPAVPLLLLAAVQQVLSPPDRRRLPSQSSLISLLSHELLDAQRGVLPDLHDPLITTLSALLTQLWQHTTNRKPAVSSVRSGQVQWRDGLGWRDSVAAMLH